MKRILTIALSLSLLAVFASSQGQNIKDPSVHFYQQKFQLAFNGSIRLALPRTNAPVRIEASITNIRLAANFHPMQPVNPILLQGITVFDTRTGLFPVGATIARGETDMDGIEATITANNGGLILLTKAVYPSDNYVAGQPFEVTVNMWF